jgi:DNA-binding GntR family transcriptional regulator
MESRGRERRGTEVTRIAAAIRKEILSGELLPGAPLRQESLAETHAASRMPVRDALRVLEGEGFVDMIPNRGARVASLDPKDYMEICELRAVLEPLAIRRAVPELSDSWIDRVEAIQAEAETAGVDRFGALNAAFHATLYEPAGRPRLLAQIRMLHDLADRYLRIAVVELDYLTRSHAEHRAILAACRVRDAERAAGLVADHITQAGEELLKRLARAGRMPPEA